MLTYVVVSAVLSHSTTALESKFVPFTVSVNATPPGAAEAGERLVIVGGRAETVKGAADDVPEVSVTVTFTVPAVAIKLAGTAAVN